MRQQPLKHARGRIAARACVAIEEVARWSSVTPRGEQLRRSASSRVSAYGIFVSRLRASACRLSGSLSRMFRRQWFQRSYGEPKVTPPSLVYTPSDLSSPRVHKSSPAL